MQLKVARNGNWVMSTKVLGGEDPRTTRKYRSVSLEKRGFSDRHSAIDDFSFFFGELTGKMLGEAGLEKCGAR